MAEPAFFEVMGMWYVIQVLTGHEEKMKEMIERSVEDSCFDSCFYLKRERVWRRDGKCIVHVETMFPGYLFVVTDLPMELFKRLKQIPQFTRLLRTEENCFLSVTEEERKLLENLVLNDTEKTVRLSEVELDGEKRITGVSGPLAAYKNCIVKKKIRLRYVVVRVRLFGRERDILTGIKLKTD